MAKVFRGMYGSVPVRDSIDIDVSIYVRKQRCDRAALTKAIAPVWRFLGFWWKETCYNDRHYGSIGQKTTTRSIVDKIFHAIWEFFGEHVDVCISTTRFPGGPLMGKDKTIEEDWVVDADDFEYQIWKETYDSRQRRAQRDS